MVEKLWDKAAEIIATASATPLGILALIILAIVIVTQILFIPSDENNTKIFVIVLLVFAFCGVGAGAIYTSMNSRIAPSIPSEALSLPPQAQPPLVAPPQKTNSDGDMIKPPISTGDRKAENSIKRTRLRVCNQTKNAVWVALAHRGEGDNSSQVFVTGWIEAKPSVECKQVGDGENEKEIYWIARRADGGWLVGTNGPWCIGSLIKPFHEPAKKNCGENLRKYFNKLTVNGAPEATIDIY